MGTCRICQENKANKTNSHQLPSFLAVMINSNGTYKRGGSELMFKMDKYQNHIYATGLSSTKWESTFDDLSEERLEEITKNPVSEDYVFCSDCEKSLGYYIESPYGSFYKNGQKISNELPLVFWISVVWRLSTQKGNGFSLGGDLEEKLRFLLDQYLKLQKERKDTSALFQDLNISYQMVNCPDYCKNEGGIFYCDYDEENQRLTLFIGDICISISFMGIAIPDSFVFYGIEDYLRRAKVNKGTEPEQKVEVDKETFRQAMKRFVEKAAPIRISGFFEIADAAWRMTGRFGYMPLRMKVAFVEKLVLDNVKMGERYTNKHLVKVFNEVVHNPLLYI